MELAQVLQRSLRGVVFENPDGSHDAISWQEPPSQSEAVKRCNFVLENIQRVQTLDFQWARGVRATIPMTHEDLDVKVTVKGGLCDGRLQGSRQLNLGPRSYLGEMWNRLYNNDMAAPLAVLCHAFGGEAPFSCEGCEDGPFDLCVVYRDQNKACSNCIYTGCEQLCQWKRLSDLDSDGGHGFVPPEAQKGDDPDSRHEHTSPKARSARQSRRDSDDDPDYEPCKKRKASDSDGGDDYVPPKTRRKGQPGRSAPERHSERPPEQPRTSGVESDKIPELSPLIDLTGEDERRLSGI